MRPTWSPGGSTQWHGLDEKKRRDARAGPRRFDHTPVLLMPGMLGFAWGGTLRLLAEGLGIELDEIREVHERRPATKPLQIGPYPIEEGTTAALRFEVQGIVDDEVAVVVEHVTRLDDDLAPEWPKSKGSYRVLIRGVPSMQVEYEFQDERGDHAVSSTHHVRRFVQLQHDRHLEPKFELLGPRPTVGIEGVLGPRHPDDTNADMSRKPLCPRKDPRRQRS